MDQASEEAGPRSEATDINNAGGWHTQYTHTHDWTIFIYKKKNNTKSGPIWLKCFLMIKTTVSFSAESQPANLNLLLISQIYKTYLSGVYHVLL